MAVPRVLFVPMFLVFIILFERNNSMFCFVESLFDLLATLVDKNDDFANIYSGGEVCVLKIGSGS